uniref:Uncharacterized protein n=1 Tax=Rhizophora mucronata TaxID=61149 RepID=A0A2P2NE49_RHIMU
MKEDQAASSERKQRVPMMFNIWIKVHSISSSFTSFKIYESLHARRE